MRNKFIGQYGSKGAVKTESHRRSLPKYARAERHSGPGIIMGISLRSTSMSKLLVLLLILCTPCEGHAHSPMHPCTHMLIHLLDCSLTHTWRYTRSSTSIHPSVPTLPLTPLRPGPAPALVQNLLWWRLSVPVAFLWLKELWQHSGTKKLGA